MLQLPIYPTDKFDQKGQAGLQALLDLQNKVLSSEEIRVYKPSQNEIAKISQLVFRARITNQYQLNEWFIQSTNNIIQQVTQKFRRQHVDVKNDDKLISEIIPLIHTLQRFIYYSGVFIVDANESAMLFTKALHSVRQQLIDTFLERLINQVIQETRSLPLGLIQLENKMYHVKELLEILRAYGWGQLTFKLKNSQLIIIPIGDNDDNIYYKETFEDKYTKTLLEYVSTLNHDTPLLPLTQQIAHEHLILNYISPSSEKFIMDQIEGQSIMQVVKLLEKRFQYTIDHPEQIVEVVTLFKQVESNQNLDVKNLQFEIGTQFQTIPCSQIVKPFQILAGMLRNYYIQNVSQCGSLQNLVKYIQKHSKYIEENFENNPDILYGYNAALEVIINKINVSNQLIEQLLTEDSQILFQIVQLLHNPSFTKQYCKAFIHKMLSQLNPENLQAKLNSNFREKAIAFKDHIKKQDVYHSTLILSLIQVVQSFEDQYYNLNQVMNLKIPELFFSSQDIINTLLLPIQLQQRIPDAKQICLNYGFAVILIQNIQVIVSNPQVIVLTALDETKNLNKDKLTQKFGQGILKGLIGLISVGLVQENNGILELSLNQWQKKQSKNVIILVEKK